MLRTASSTWCNRRANKSARVVASLIENVTLTRRKRGGMCIPRILMVPFTSWPEGWVRVNILTSAAEHTSGLKAVAHQRPCLWASSYRDITRQKRGPKCRPRSHSTPFFCPTASPVSALLISFSHKTHFFKKRITMFIIIWFKSQESGNSSFVFFS